jgi:transketolase
MRASEKEGGLEYFIKYFCAFVHFVYNEKRLSALSDLDQKLRM